MVVTLGLGGVGLIGLVDYLTGYELSVSIFYLGPILGVAWFAGRRWGYFLCVLSEAVALFTELHGGLLYSAAWIHAWNSLARLASFVIGVFLLCALRVALDNERRLARRDRLTDIANRNAFFETAAGEIARSRRHHRPLTLAYLDLDHFKDVNDLAGHEAGDEVLRRVARVLEQSTRSTDLAARLGGDEFVILFPELGKALAQEVVAKLRGRLREAVAGTPVTFSIGVATFDGHGEETALSMLGRADANLYSAKRQGKDRTIS